MFGHPSEPLGSETMGQQILPHDLTYVPLPGSSLALPALVPTVPLRCTGGYIVAPKHGSWLNMIEMFFSKITRSFRRHIRVGSKLELIKRIYQDLEEIKRTPVVFRWTYKMDEIKL